MQTEILVSVICATYNHEKYIRQAIEGFVAQKTTFPFEIVIHDDASTDATAEIIREYEAKYPELIRPIYQKENLHSRKISRAPYLEAVVRGKYIALCEGDDYWTDPLKLEKQVRHMEENPACALCIHNSIEVDDQGAYLGDHIIHPESCWDSMEVLIRGGGYYCATNSIVARTRDYFTYTKTSYNKILSMDATLQMHLGAQGSIYVFADKMSAYRVGVPQSATARYSQSYEAYSALHMKLVAMRKEFDRVYDYRYHEAIEDANLETEFSMAFLRRDVEEFKTHKYDKVIRKLPLKDRISTYMEFYTPKLKDFLRNCRKNSKKGA